MSQAVIDTVANAAQTLRQAMEAGDPDKMTEAATAFATALETLRGVGAWRVDPELKTRLRGIIARLESDQHLSRLLGDLVRQRLSLLAGITSGATAPLTYGRQG